ncbi:MotE family protein [Devosia sp. CN2-171]|jgi:flagellar motility protein MotE (MotC chaperone)|uniref:MotE family protein n=1 Tax=Devosia sp. CN2-171 TaxID=3400909 RepID=UPI003BF79998
MKTPRLLPVVIAAATALLLFKGFGLVTDGGYVLSGTTQAVAAGGGGEHAAPATAGTAVDPTMDLPAEATMADTSPTLEDKSPVLPLEAEGTAHGVPAAEEGHGEETAVAEAEPAVPEDPVTVDDDYQLQAACPPEAPTLAEAGAEQSEVPADAAAKAPKPNCIPIPVNEHGDAIPLEVNSDGKLAPVAADEGSAAELTGRLGERRADLDAREKELDMRLALVEAAEKRIEERTAVLKSLEAQINALVEEKKSDEKEQFVGIVAMYETMKPKEAATIFNALDNEVLLRVARAMSPRKMAPILAKMDPMKAKTLTAGLARQEAEPTAAPGTVEDLASLPQIVGQ